MTEQDKANNMDTAELQKRRYWLEDELRDCRGSEKTIRLRASLKSVETALRYQCAI